MSHSCEPLGTYIVVGRENIEILVMGRFTSCVIFFVVLMAMDSHGIIGKVFKEVKRVVSKVNREVKRVGHQVEKEVRRALPIVDKLIRNVIIKPIKTAVKFLGPEKVKVSEKYETFTQNFMRVVEVNGKEYRVEQITPCRDGKHIIKQVETPIQVTFKDGVIKMQDSYCTKCGQHFYNRQNDEL